MKLTEKQEGIPLLISKKLIGSITPDEEEILKVWRNENIYNEKVYQRLMDTKRLQIEYHRYRLTDAARPLSEMKKRLLIKERKRPFYAAAVAVLLIGFGCWVFQRQQLVSVPLMPVAETEISAGTTKAILTLQNGKTVELTDDTEKNKELLEVARLNVPDIRDIPEQELITPRGGEFKIILEDGTEVWLNAASRLRYPESFNGDQRRVEIEGEAYFKVAKDSARLFIVSSGNQEVCVYGTEFNVSAYNDEKEIRTTLVEGSIALRPLNNSQSELLLTPGTQAIFNREDETARVINVDTEVITSWRTGVFVFEGQTMEQIMHALSRWYDFDYEFKDAAVAKTIFMGSIPKYSSFSEVSDIFHKLGGVRLRQKGRKVIISTK